MVESTSLSTEVVYASETEQISKIFDIPAGTTIEKAIQLSGILNDFPLLHLSTLSVGIFSEKKPLDFQLTESGLRIEIYRPLKIDPKEARRLRGKKQS